MFVSFFGDIRPISKWSFTWVRIPDTCSWYWYKPNDTILIYTGSLDTEVSPIRHIVRTVLTEQMKGVELK